MEYGETIGRRIAQLLEERSWTQGQLAMRANMTQPSVWALVKGSTKNPGIATVAAVARAFGMSIDEFLDEHFDAVADAANPSETRFSQIESQLKAMEAQLAQLTGKGTMTQDAPEHHITIDHEWLKAVKSRAIQHAKHDEHHKQINSISGTFKEEKPQTLGQAVQVIDQGLRIHRVATELEAEKHSHDLGDIAAQLEALKPLVSQVQLLREALVESSHVTTNLLAAHEAALKRLDALEQRSSVK